MGRTATEIWTCDHCGDATTAMVGGKKRTDEDWRELTVSLSGHKPITWWLCPECHPKAMERLSMALDDMFIGFVESLIDRCSERENCSQCVYYGVCQDVQEAL